VGVGEKRRLLGEEEIVTTSWTISCWGCFRGKRGGGGSNPFFERRENKQTQREEGKERVRMNQSGFPSPRKPRIKEKNRSTKS